jgi:hypothetical protein
MRTIAKYEKYQQELVKILRKRDFRVFGQHLAVPTYRECSFKIEEGPNQSIIFEFAYKNRSGEIINTKERIKYGPVQSRG